MEESKAPPPAGAGGTGPEPGATPEAETAEVKPAEAGKAEAKTGEAKTAEAKTAAEEESSKPKDPPKPKEPPKPKTQEERIAALERGQERITRFGGAGVIVAVLASLGALALGIMNQSDSATKDDVEDIEQRLDETQTVVKQATEEQLTAANNRVGALEGRVTSLDAQIKQQAQTIATLQTQVAAATAAAQSGAGAGAGAGTGAGTGTGAGGGTGNANP